ncbi:MAG TPA: hypothetical protein VM600_09715 [Actinomycetota bacterium]|nr:hypothetical protein [Actinomycetota bacterium]
MNRAIASAITATLLVGGFATVSAVAQPEEVKQAPTPSTDESARSQHDHRACIAGRPLGALVDNGTITQAQADAIHAKMKERLEKMRAAGDLPKPRTLHRGSKRPKVLALTSVLPDLVKDGTITQSQADAITKWFEDRRKERRGVRRAPMSSALEARDTIAV